MRLPIFGGNWKMNLELGSAQRLARDVRNRLGSRGGLDVVIFPPFPLIHPVARIVEDSRVKLGAQDVHPEVSGAYTGAVSAGMLASLGVTYVLVGHSERRHVFGDDDNRVACKLRRVVAAGLTPVLCIGETLQEREAGRTHTVLKRQLDTALSGCRVSEGLVIAYEPVWAIGTGLTPRPDEVGALHGAIRDMVARLLGSGRADATRIQYGGSVKPNNAAGLMSQPGVDGALVGGASLDAGSFAAICNSRAGSARFG